jgi:ADP-heptose:LPS heptosyltransferase
VSQGVAASDKFVAIHAVSRWPTKNWDAASFARTADLLRARGLGVVWTGGSNDRAAIDTIRGQMRSDSARLDGQTTPRTLAAVFARARVLLATDTGPMHIGVAVGIPVVALFGPTNPALTGPYGAQHVVLRTGISCSPCLSETCRTTRHEKHACMLRLRPEQVVEAVLEKARPVEPAESLNRP